MTRIVHPSRQWRHRLVDPSAPSIERLELRQLLAASLPNDIKVAEQTMRLDDSLLHLYQATQSGADLSLVAATQDVQIDPQQEVAVTLHADNVQAVSKALSAVGFRVIDSNPKLYFAEGLLPIQSLGLVAQAGSGNGQFGLLATPAPITQTGSVDSQSDFVLEADRVRATLPAAIDGTGQRVGVISDSYNFLGGEAADIASGDLPSGGLSYEQDYNLGGTDEGRAMLQVIHDLAPGASLAFATAVGGKGNFAQSIANLADPTMGDASIIVDDALYPDEPMFQDGEIGDAINSAVNNGIAYFSAAGNFADQAYESTDFHTAFDSITTTDDRTISGPFYDFDPGAGVDTRQRITLRPGAKIVLSLQWNDPVQNVDTDLDFYLSNPATGKDVAESEVMNPLFGSPVEIITYQNPSQTTPLSLDVSIFKSDGPDPGRIKYVNYGDPITFDEFATNSPTIVPHAAAVGAEAVGAAPYFNQDHPEPFTSQGPSTFLFASDGTPIPPEVRQVPQITSIDGVDNTFFGTDTDGDGYPNFFGTSAAAASAAAVAALVRQANPTFTPAQVYSRMQETAQDIGPAGFDNTTGFGVINAFDAVYPTITPATLNFSDGFESGALSSAYETRATGSGRILVTGNNGPFSGSDQLTLDSSIASGGGLNEVTLHVDASGAGEKLLSFEEKEFNDDDNPMPSSFIGSSNSDGVALSVDGTHWYQIVSLTGPNSTNAYTLKSFDLSAIAAFNGIALGADTLIRFQQYGAQPIASDGIAFDDVSVMATTTLSSIPGAPDLLPGGDSGISNSDNITNHDNSSPLNALSFSISGTIPGAMVKIYVDGIPLGSALAVGSSTTVTTLGLLDLPDGVHQITARQTEPGKSESADSTALAVTIDTTAPSIVRNSDTPAFLFDSAPHQLVFNFSEDVQQTVDAADLSVQRLGSGSMPPQAASVIYNSPNNSATFSLNGIVPDGNFRATVNAADITDVAGNPLSGDPTFDFFFLTADANHDRLVNTLDFTALAQHFNEASGTFGHGNFNYDGRTNALDFNLLATFFGTDLPQPTPAMAYPASRFEAPSPASLFSNSAIDAQYDNSADDLLDPLPTRFLAI